MSRRPLALIAAVLLAGCASQQTQPPTQSSASAEDPCRSVIDVMPDSLDGEALTDRTRTTATWGTDMVLTCGVDVPAAYKKTSEMYVVNDVAWFGEKQGDKGYVFTAVGREPLVAIAVPPTHKPEVNPLVDLAPAMNETTTVTGPAGQVSP